MNLREKHEQVGLMMTITLLETQFDILALAFGRHNAAAAAAALVVIEDETARQLSNLHDERIVDGQKADEAIIRQVAARLRASIREARQSVADASRPH
jgi:hypothetical protein